MRQVRKEAPERVRSLRSGNSRILQILVGAADHVFSLDDATDVELRGQFNLFGQPEFADSERLASVVDLIQHSELVKALSSGSQDSGVQVSIGDENPLVALKSCSVVSRTYRRGGAVGIMAVIGPMRMPYPDLLALVDSADDLVEDLLS